MNRREFLLGLLSVPFGWKMLFKKEVKEEKWIEQVEEIDDCVECEGAGWAVSPNDLVGLGGDLEKMINTGREPMSEREWNSRMDCRTAYLGGGEIGKADGSLFHALRNMDEWQVAEDKDGCECPECSGGLPLPDWVADGMRSGTYFEREVEILLDPPPLKMDNIRVDGIDAETYCGLVMPPYPVGYSLGKVEIANLDEGKFTFGPSPMWVVYPDGRVAKCDDITAPDPIWYELLDAEWEFSS